LAAQEQLLSNSNFKSTSVGQRFLVQERWAESAQILLLPFQIIIAKGVYLPTTLDLFAKFKSNAAIPMVRVKVIGCSSLRGRGRG